MKGTYHSELIQRNQYHLNRQKDIGRNLRTLYVKIENGAEPEVLKEYIKNMIVETHTPFLGKFDLDS